MSDLKANLSEALSALEHERVERVRLERLFVATMRGRPGVNELQAVAVQDWTARASGELVRLELFPELIAANGMSHRDPLPVFPVHRPHLTAGPYRFSVYIERLRGSAS